MAGREEGVGWGRGVKKTDMWVSQSITRAGKFFIEKRILMIRIKYSKETLNVQIVLDKRNKNPFRPCLDHFANNF